MSALHCFADVRSRNCVPFEDGVAPRVYPMGEHGLNVRLAKPGVDWAEVTNLRERFLQNSKDSLDEYLDECLAKKNLRLRLVRLLGQCLVLSTL